MKRFHVKIAGFSDHVDATLLDVARWVNGGEHNRPTPRQFDQLARMKVGNTVANSKQGWSIQRVRDQ